MQSAIHPRRAGDSREDRSNTRCRAYTCRKRARRDGKGGVMPTEDQTTVYFDGACPLCRAEIGLYRKGDSACALRMVDVSQPDPALPQGLDRGRAMARFHVRTADGRLLSGAAAFVEVWRQLPRWRWAARVASLPGVVPVLEIGYRLFLPVRPMLSRLFGAAQRHVRRFGSTGR